MPENVSIERRQLLEIFGAEITLEPGRGGQQRRDPPGRRRSSPTSPATCSSTSTATRPTRSRTTRAPGPEIWRDCPEVDVFVAGLGTSGTLMGVGRYLKEQKPEVRVVAVEPPAGELVQGLRNLDDGFVPPIFTPDVLDRKLIVRPRESIEWTRRLLDECGRVRRHLVRRGDRRRGEGRGDDGRRARSSRCCPTAAGSTSRPARGPTTSTSSRNARSASTTGDATRPRRRTSRARSRSCATAAWSRSRPRRSTASAPTRTNRDALRRLYAVKGRPAEHPVIVHLARAEQLDDWARRRLARGAHAGRRVLARARSPSWCGAPPACPDEVTGGLDTVGLRVPGHPVALRAARGVRRRARRAVGQPLRPGEPDHRRRGARRARRRRRRSCSTAAPCTVGVESTIVDCTDRRSRGSCASAASPRSSSEALLGVELPVGGDDAARRARSRRTTRRARASRSSTAATLRRPRGASSIDAGEQVGVLAGREVAARRCRRGP